VLVPNPSYPIHPYGFIIAGGSVRHIPVPGAHSTTEFLAALERAVRHTVPKPIALVLNYPSNPTAQVVDLDFYAAVVDFCKRQGIWILSDLAYAEIYFDGNPPTSVLQVPGARDIAVEFTSMSKTYSMAGWRIGFAAGNKTLITALTRIKSYLDYGAFTPIQVAATAALNGPQDCIVEARNTYKERRDVLIEGLASAGWELPAPSASMFAWAPIPKAFEELGSLAFSKLLLTQANVAVSPGIGFGEHGDAHVRIAMVENKHRIRQAIRNIRQVMIDPSRSIDLYLRGVGDNITPLKARA
jgi:alanine-synthesizing transaminase